MDEVREKATSRLAAIEQAIAELRAEAARLEQFLEVYEALDVVPRSQLDAKAPTVIPATPEPDRMLAFTVREKKKRTTTNPPPAEVVDAVKQIIDRAGYPMTRGQLLPQLTRRGLEIKGTYPSKVLGTNLWRSGQFVQLEGLGYWPKDKPYPPAGYEPDPDQGL